MNSPMLASDANNPNFVGAYNPDAAIVVKFYSRAVHQPFESQKQGRPIYLDVDYIQIFTPGNQLNIVDTPARWEHKQRFAQQWAAYQAGKGDGSEMGTPVNQWPLLSSAQAEELRGVKFFTVEQIANASDGQLQSIGMVGGMNPHVLRERAKAFLNAAAGNAPVEAQAQENAELKSRLAAMEAQMQAMLASGAAAPIGTAGAVSVTIADQPKKRHRRTKAEIEAERQAQSATVQSEPTPTAPPATAEI